MKRPLDPDYVVTKIQLAQVLVIPFFIKPFRLFPFFFLPFDELVHPKICFQELILSRRPFDVEFSWSKVRGSTIGALVDLKSEA